MKLGPILAACGTAIVVLVLGFVAWAWHSSRLPATYSAMDYAVADFGGAPAPAEGDQHGGADSVSVAALHGPLGPQPDVRYVLTAAHATITLTSGHAVDALAFNGVAPGPELRVRQGALVEVRLANRDVKEGVTIHWHGLDVPNGEDGVAGITQDAVMPGDTHTYRFVASQAGTYWYHTHQVSSKEVRRGLFGAIVVEPVEPLQEGLDLVVAAHTFDGIPTLNAHDGLARKAVPPGTHVRLRLVNTDGNPQRLIVDGTAFRVVAIDGTDLNQPGLLEGKALELPAGGRYDVAFTMPTRPVGVWIADGAAGLALSENGAATPAAPTPGPTFDAATYGQPAPTPFNASSHFDRHFSLEIGRKPSFLDGHPGMQWAINGQIFPRVPMFVVKRGDLVRVTIKNTTKAVHPMHLHGHHMLVLSRDGVPVSGTPWWIDTLEVQPGESYDLAFRADNPGIWMNHCHNLRHAADGLTMHVAYEGITTPFKTGGTAHNHPE